MNKNLAILCLSSLVFSITAVLVGFHVAFFAAFFLTRSLSIHLQSLGVFYLGQTYDVLIVNSEFLHMQEVGQLFIAIHILFVVFSLLSGFLFWYQRKRSVLFSSWFFLPAIISSSIALVATIFFDSAFDIFHMILFRNDYWIFHPESPIILAYPQWFFLTEFILIICSAWVFLAVIYRFLKHN